MPVEQPTLYELLPAHIRMRDDGDGTLQELLRIFNLHADLLARDIQERMYDDWFIETCQDWVVSYIGDLLGYERIHSTAADIRTASGRRLARVLSPRREIGNLIAYRRRKGTLWLLEELSRDVAGWPARAVEFYRLLTRVEHINHLHPERPAYAEIRDAGRLEFAHTPFDTACHSVDVRRIISKNSPGSYNIPNVGLFIFRTRRYSVTQTSAYCHEDIGSNRFTFSILGNDGPLYRIAEQETEPTHLAEESNFEVPIRRRALANDLQREQMSPGSAVLYGEEKSLVIYAPDWPRRGDGRSGKGEPSPIDPSQIDVANLSGWTSHVPKNRVAVDPILGRIKFPKSQPPRNGVLVSYGYGYVADIGGGEYERPAWQLPERRNHFFVDPQLSENQPTAGWFMTIDAAFKHWRSLPAASGADNELLVEARERALVIELTRSDLYKGRIDLALEAGEFLGLVAGDCTRPILWMSDDDISGRDTLLVRGGRGARVVFHGILVVGRGVTVSGDISPDTGVPDADDLCEVVFSHSTLVPGWILQGNCDRRRPAEPSITLENTTARLRVELSIVGAIRVDVDPRRFEPVAVDICDSIIDGLEREQPSDRRQRRDDPGSPDDIDAAPKVAIGSSESCPAYARLRIVRSTIVGEVEVHQMLLAENSIFTSPVRVARRQPGCMRYSFVPIEGSQTPQRYRCQPDHALSLIKKQRQASNSGGAAFFETDGETINRVTPCFESMRYGTPAYMRLCRSTAVEITSGADDESEMGVYHDLLEPQRLVLLRRRLSEYIPASAEGAVIFAS